MQRIVVAGIDFDFLRILMVFGSMRIFARREYLGFRWIGLDTAVVLWVMAGVFFPILLFGLSAVLIGRLGMAYDNLGMYFLFRVLLHTLDDFRATIRSVIYISLLVAAFFALEMATGRNVFAIFGGVPEITGVREGRLRCQGAFSHPILAGAFWAAILPLVVCEWRGSFSNRWIVKASAVACLLIVFASASSTPIFGVLAAGFCGAMFPFRSHLRFARWAFVLLLVFLHLVMQAPVWHLISRVSAIGGSSGWHRYVLIDGFIRHWNEWWAIGSNVGTSHWGYMAHDVTNFYVVQGLTGGIVQLGLWFWLIAIAFAYVGRMRIAAEGSGTELVVVWGVGVSLFVHIVNFIGVSYYGQIWLGWYMVLGGIGSLYASSLRTQTVSNEEYGTTRIRDGRASQKPFPLKAIPSRSSWLNRDVFPHK
ncbi:MAG: hypothetical protein JNK74_04625 [Candidatus Hydrogenedentes bacterium]|nr:hypothetical protein [Candidatus Hydrogenedentota bacterium]